MTHIPVLPELVREAFAMPPGLVVDATGGGGGHSRILLELGHRVITLDKDTAAVERLRALFAAEIAAGRSEIRPGPFSRLGDVTACDGILADLGFSSFQVDDPARGFSFASPAPPDMRLDTSQPLTAADLIERSSAEELARILREYGEEKDAWRLARNLAGRRFTSSAELAGEIEKLKGGRRGQRIHPATRAFQALRIAVNGELDELRALLALAPDVVRPGGRVAIISFHSLEDRLVKETFRSWEGPCTCPPELPECRCRPIRRATPLWKGGRTADDREVETNPRSRSARMRVMTMIAYGDEA